MITKFKKQKITIWQCHLIRSLYQEFSKNYVLSKNYDIHGFAKYILLDRKYIGFFTLFRNIYSNVNTHIYMYLGLNM